MYAEHCRPEIGAHADWQSASEGAGIALNVRGLAGQFVAGPTPCG
jgi:hypothetical protein